MRKNGRNCETNAACKHLSQSGQRSQVDFRLLLQGHGRRTLQLQLLLLLLLLLLSRGRNESSGGGWREHSEREA